MRMMMAVAVAAVLSGCGGSSGSSGDCASGCWDGSICRTGTDVEACGMGGGACVRCGEGYACETAYVASGSPGGAQVPTARLCTAPTTPPPLCSWAMTAPATSSDAIWNPGDGVDCVTPDAMPNGTYQIGLYAAGVRLVFHVAPGLHAEVDGDPGFHLIAIGDDAAGGDGWTCYDWTGRANFALGADGWMVEADLVCTTDGAPRAVALTLTGRRR